MSVNHKDQREHANSIWKGPGLLYLGVVLPIDPLCCPWNKVFFIILYEDDLINDILIGHIEHYILLTHTVLKKHINYF